MERLEEATKASTCSCRASRGVREPRRRGLRVRRLRQRARWLSQAECVGGVADDAVAGVAQEGGTTRLTRQEARLALAAAVVGAPGGRGDDAHQGLRRVGVEIIGHDVPAGRRRGGRHPPWIWARKSAAVRGGPPRGAATAPVATSRLGMQVRVPWRTYSNSRRSTLPGAGGRPGGVRSRACTPVSSSVRSTRAPRAANPAAAR